MTKSNFLHVLSNASGELQLSLKVDGDGWLSARHVSIVLFASGGFSSKTDKSGRPIGVGRRNNSVRVDGFSGGFIRSGDAGAMMDRAKKALDKYERWANEALAERTGK